MAQEVQQLNSAGSKPRSEAKTVLFLSHTTLPLAARPPVLSVPRYNNANAGWQPQPCGFLCLLPFLLTFEAPSGLDHDSEGVLWLCSVSRLKMCDCSLA